MYAYLLLEMNTARKMIIMMMTTIPDIAPPMYTPVLYRWPPSVRMSKIEYSTTDFEYIVVGKTDSNNMDWRYSKLTD